MQYLHRRNDRQTTIVEISGTCESHEKGYDETKIIVAESVVFLNWQSHFIKNPNNTL